MPPNRGAKNNEDSTNAINELEAASAVVVEKTDTHLSTAQIAALHTTGVECVPAPGVGKRLKPLGFGGRKILNSVAFSGPANLKLIYGLSGHITNAAAFSAPNTVIQAASNKDFDGFPNGNGVVLDTADMENLPLVVKLTESANRTDGAVATFTIASGGTGYSIGAEVGIVGVTSGAGATIEVDTVGGGGEILTAHLTAGGEEYIVENGATASGGLGNDATFNITAITVPPAGNGSLDVTVVYSVVDVA